MILKAYAKINLHLDVGPKRRDGYHSLKTIFQEVNLHDSLTFHLSDGPIRLTVSPRGLPTGQDNLIVRALELLKKSLKVKKGMFVHLDKKIPMGAGLGGGSSDAAAALWGGWLLWKRKARPKRIPPVLMQCARQLGADVPFFLRGGRAYAEGIGDKLTPLKKRPKRWLVLVYPRVQVSTAEAYKLLDESRGKSSPRNVLVRGPGFHPEHNLDPGQKIAGMTTFFNSFEPVILKKYPAIAAAKQALVKAGCTDSMMSGSGSTMFGFVKNKRAGELVMRLLRKYNWKLFLVHT